MLLPCCWGRDQLQHSGLSFWASSALVLRPRGICNRTEQPLQDKTQGSNSQGTSVPWQREWKFPVGRGPWARRLDGPLRPCPLCSCFSPSSSQGLWTGSDSASTSHVADSQHLGHTSAAHPHSTLSPGLHQTQQCLIFHDSPAQSQSWPVSQWADQVP